MKISRLALRKMIVEEMSSILSHDDPTEVEAIEDALAGGRKKLEKLLGAATSSPTSMRRASGLERAFMWMKALSASSRWRKRPSP